MKRHCLPLLTVDSDMPAQITEVRLPVRSGRHNVRNGWWEVRP